MKNGDKKTTLKKLYLQGNLSTYIVNKKETFLYKIKNLCKLFIGKVIIIIIINCYYINKRQITLIKKKHILYLQGLCLI